MKELIKKIAAAKKEIGKISKDSENPFFKSKYFDINSLLEHVEPMLEKHGLVVLQPIRDGVVYSEIYNVESGNSIGSSIQLPELTDPQKLGSAVTYYRRYTLQSLLSLQAEDDDGNKASKATTEAKPIWLTKAQYDKAINADAKGITATINAYEKSGYAMKKEYKTALLNRLAILNANA